MTHMSISKTMTGSPWHVEKFVKAENDTRRHRSRCVFYDKEEKYCYKQVGVCIGASHCKDYKETGGFIGHKTKDPIIHEQDSIHIVLSEYQKDEGFYWLSNGKSCPFDRTKLERKLVDVKNKKGKQKKLNTLVCPKCNRKFFVIGSLPETIDLEEYNIYPKYATGLVIERQRKIDAMDLSVIKVFHQKFGEGKIIERSIELGKEWITVEFLNRIDKFDAKTAFDTETLKKF